jgi:hypothetical protein
MTTQYTMTPDNKGRYLISENRRVVARAYSQGDALRITRSLADADTLQAQIAMLEREPITSSFADRIRQAFMGRGA